MARMFPNEPPAEGPGAEAERKMYLALRDGLPDDYYVYCNLRYLEAQRAREGEADFLVLHRTRGMLVIECKGNGVRCRGDGKWVRLERGREVPMTRAPDQQARDQVHELEQEFRSRLAGAGLGLRRLPFTFGYAVAFPRGVRGVAGLPLSLQDEIVYDARDLVRMGTRVPETLEFWCRASGTVKPPSEQQFNRFRSHVLNPQLSFIPCMGADMAAEAQQLHQLSQEQAAVLEGILHNRRLNVAGGAGSGKTMVALEAARLLACEGHTVQLLCFNRALGRFLDRCASTMDTGGGSVRARHFHGLCAEAFKQHLGQPISPPADGEARAAFWEHEAPVVMLEALEAGKLDHADHLVVDEGQDFCASWWDVVQELMADRDAGRLFIFHDSAQEIFGRDNALPEAGATWRLTRNFRNTQAIAGVVHKLGRVDMRPCARCPEGKPPSVHRQGSRRDTLKALERLVERLMVQNRVQPDQVVILTPHTRKNSTLAEVEELAGVPLASVPDQRDGRVLHTTIGAFKGLESDVVILLDVDPEDEMCSRKARYVAASRARHRLHVFARGDWTAG